MYFHLCFWKWWIGHNPMSFVVARAMVKSWIAYWLPRSEVGEVAPFLLSHVVFPRSSAADLQVCLPITDHLPCHYCTTCVLSDLRLISMRPLEVVLSGRVDGSDYCTWWTITSGACAWLWVDVCTTRLTDIDWGRHRTSGPMQSVVTGSILVICLEALIYADTLDLHMECGRCQLQSAAVWI